jgi:hypothetical protein
LNAVVNRPAPVARQKTEVFADCWEEVMLRFVPLQADEAGYGGEVGGGWGWGYVCLWVGAYGCVRAYVCALYILL